MLLLTKLAAIGVIIWFYMAAEKNGQPSVKWAIIGFIGYVLTWFLADIFIDSVLSAVIAKKKGSAFIIGQLPAFAGLVGAYFIKKKLISDMGKTS